MKANNQKAAVSKLKRSSQPRRILLSRTDGIGDVVLTLPMAAIIKQHFPGCDTAFLGRNYTEALIRSCRYIDDFLNWEELERLPKKQQAERLAERQFDIIIHVFPRKEIAEAARRAGVPLRIGTSHRWFHWSTCNRLVHFSRRSSMLHEAQLNLRLLEPLDIPPTVTLSEIADLYGLDVEPSESSRSLIDTKRFNLILHPKSKGSGKEWSMENWAKLITVLPQERFRLYITGSESEGRHVRPFLVEPFPWVTDLTGKLDLRGLIAFIAASDGLLACSTGPLHLAAAIGKAAVGLYSSRRPIHPGRWAPLGKRALVIEDGIAFRYKGHLSISVETVAAVLMNQLSV